MSLTDTQLVLLSSASQREDHLVTLPPNLKGGAAKKDRQAPRPRPREGGVGQAQSAGLADRRE
jgi:hypothetical protein